MKVESDIDPTPVSATVAPLYQHLRQRLDSHRSSAVKRNARYKRIATVFNYALPLLALGLTILISLPVMDNTTKIFAAGIVAAVLTVTSSVNSVMKPGERFHAYVAASISIQAITFDLESGLRERRGQPDAEILEFLSEINTRITVVGEAMASLPIPRLTL